MSPQFATGAPRLLSPVRATAVFVAIAVSSGHAQNLNTVARNADTSAASAAAPSSEVETSEVQLLVGRSTLVNIGSSITRVSLTSPNVADAMVTTPSQLLVHGKAPGTISMFVWDKAGGIKRYEVVVRRDLSQLVEQMKQLFPGEPIEVHSNGKDVVISGVVGSKYVVDKASEVASGYVEKPEDVVNLLRQVEGVASDQVMLRVRFAEVSRTAMTELGVNLLASGFKNGRWFGRTTTQQFAAPEVDDGKTVFSDFLNLFLLDSKNNLSAVVKALQTKGLFQSLAEPNLIAENGKEASFLAGGEYPYPVVQGNSGGTVRHDPVQGVRRPLALHADDRRGRSGETQGGARGQLAGLRQLRLDLRIPRAGHLDAPHRDGSRIAGRPDVRDCRPDEQHRDLAALEDSGHRRHPGPWPAVQEQGRAERSDRAGRDDHAANHAPRLHRRLAEAAEHGRAVHAAAPEAAAAARAVEPGGLESDAGAAGAVA